ncbi:MAG: ChaN family lipoprotein [Comamonadaceae bacterium]|nr:ChaN family lipoprotein [Comamonadaceae bacterium]
MPPTRLSCLALLTVSLLGAGCAAPGAAPALTPDDQARLSRLLPANVLLVGEQHDAPAHQQLQRQLIDWLAARGQLAAVALEMAEQGRSTHGLPPQASPAQVQAALGWRDKAWPWRAYGPPIMAAVRAGVPVLGANLPASAMRGAMADARLDARLPPPQLAQQQERIRTGHCGLLPESQIAPMARVQIARDMAMAQTLADVATPQGAPYASPGRVALLITGNGHTHRLLGVPRFLPPTLSVRVLSAQSRPASGAPVPDAADGALAEGDLVWPTPALPAQDHCAALRQTHARPAASGQAGKAP